MIGLVTEISMVNICEEVYAWGYNTGGSYWWIGTMSGYHEIDMRGDDGYFRQCQKDMRGEEND